MKPPILPPTGVTPQFPLQAQPGVPPSAKQPLSQPLPLTLEKPKELASTATEILTTSALPQKLEAIPNEILDSNINAQILPEKADEPPTASVFPETEPLDEYDYDYSQNFLFIPTYYGNEDIVRALSNEVKTKCCFNYSVNDLHSVNQTTELFCKKSLPRYLKQFRDHLSVSVIPRLKDFFEITDFSNITMTACEFKKGDYLLCHDDLYEDRCIAFIYYLSEDWNKTDGGALRFFSHSTSDPMTDRYERVIVPRFNSMVLFRVTDTSHHEVQQVFSNKCRLAISGWFHSKDVGNKYSIAKTTSLPFIKAPIHEFKDYLPDSNYSCILQAEYTSVKTQEDMRDELKIKPVLLASNFLQTEFYKKCVDDLKNINLKWRMEGPPQHRKYEAIDVEICDSELKISLPKNSPHLKSLIEFLLSPFWLRFLNSVTNLDLAVFTGEHVPPAFTVEIQKWSEGCYTLLSDSTCPIQKQPSVEVTLFFEVDDSILVNGTLHTEERPNMSGIVVQSVKKWGEIPRTFYNSLFWIKRSRIIREEVRIKTMKWKKHNTAYKVPKRTNLKLDEAKVDRINHLLMRKIEEMREYRQNKSENHYTSPKNNSLLITMNSERTSKYTSYILRRNDTDPPKPCYYCVTLKYFTATAFDEDKE